MRAAALFRAALFAGALIAPTPACADGWGDGVDVISDNDMEDLRGGFDIPRIGITVNFGATVTTIMNGVPVLTTNITWTDAGAIVDQTMANVGVSLDQMTEEGRAALGLGGLTGAGGVVVQDGSGITALVHNVTEGALQNIVINTATGRNIEQEIDVTLELPGFDMIQQSLTTELFGIRLGDDMRGASGYPG